MSACLVFTKSSRGTWDKGNNYIQIILWRVMSAKNEQVEAITENYRGTSFTQKKLYTAG